MLQKELMGMKYLITEPLEGHKKHPAILLLHGAGSRGDDPGILLGGAHFRYRERVEDFPFITVAPRCSENTWFDMMPQLKALVRHVAALPYVDASRIYLMGASMGGYATWQLAMSMPECFAAIAPVCGGGMYWNAARLKNLPVWAFHGAKDKTVAVEESQKMVDKVNAAGGNARLTVYPNNSHDAWTDAYSDPALYEWFLQHQSCQAALDADIYNNVERFG